MAASRTVLPFSTVTWRPSIVSVTVSDITRRSYQGLQPFRSSGVPGFITSHEGREDFARKMAIYLTISIGARSSLRLMRRVGPFSLICASCVASCTFSTTSSPVPSAYCTLTVTGTSNNSPT